MGKPFWASLGEVVGEVVGDGVGDHDCLLAETNTAGYIKCDCFIERSRTTFSVWGEIDFILKTGQYTH